MSEEQTVDTAVEGPGVEATPEPPPDEELSEATLVDDLAQLAEERDAYLALAQRTQADFENYRKRVARDAAVAELRGVGRLARELLPALDSLDRALATGA